MSVGLDLYTERTKMTAADFVEKLFNAMPSTEELEEYGLDESEIEEIQRTFEVRKREQPFDMMGLPISELTKLIRDFDCSTVEIGLLRFCEKIGKSELGWHFADCEAEKVVLKQDGKVMLTDSGRPSLECANNGTAFLAALSEYILIQGDKGKWKGQVEAAAKLCAQAAGGEKYTEFFEMLCSYLR